MISYKHLYVEGEKGVLKLKTRFKTLLRNAKHFKGHGNTSRCDGDLSPVMEKLQTLDEAMARNEAKDMLILAQNRRLSKQQKWFVMNNPSSEALNLQPALPGRNEQLYQEETSSSCCCSGQNQK